MKKKYYILHTTYPILKLGFTLIELLVVISVIAILAGFGFASYGPSQKRARDGKRKADLEQIRSALEMCRTDNQSYPVGTLVSGDDIACDGTTYMTIPNDPKTGQQYSYVGTANSYTLCATLEIDSTSYCVANP